MKKLCFVLALGALFSCGETNNEGNDLKNLVALEEFEVLKSEEYRTRKFIEAYLQDVNSPEWRAKLPKYLQSNPEKFLEEHTAFRESFPNYHSTIKHLTVDGNKGIVWLNINANYVKTYSIENENDSYGDNKLLGIKAENQALSWDEVWYFDVVDGKFGTEWDFLKDNHSIIKELN